MAEENIGNDVEKVERSEQQLAKERYSQEQELKKQVLQMKKHYKEENEMLELIVRNMELNVKHYEYSQKLNVYRQREEELKMQVEEANGSNLTLVSKPPLVDLQGNPIEEK